MIKYFLYRPGQGIEVSDKIGNFDRILADEQAILWVDLCKPTDEESFILTHDFKFHPLAIEDVLYEKPRTKVDDYDTYLFLVFQAVDYIGREQGLKISEIDFFQSRNSVVTVHYDDHRIFDYLYHRAERDERLLARGGDFLMHALVDAVVDNYNSTLDIIEYEVDQVEEDVLSGPDAETLKSIFTLRRDIVHLKRIVLPQLEVVHRFSRQQYKQIGKKAAVYFSDVHDHLVRINEIVDFHREILNSSLEVYYSSISTKTNAIIKVLTMFTVFFIPPTFLVGLWGMNFENMPELEWRYGYYIALGCMLTIVVGLLMYFKKKKWL
jgi:magnesium transporter